MPKILKPYTIIPPELYIPRDADRQVENIINDMGRPGYVLVSRQMGKTNLLLNAKRRLETYDDIYVYIDLSNPFEGLKNCFENIIDTILDTNEVKLPSISNLIFKKRSEQQEVPPHKQHLNELRIILNHIKGKLVIILDEIDALTKKQYSDQIFAQIRSVYFSRVNYSELERLTYILSGVVEPNEIIKDPKISPFNIGEKIFLNDFSRKEFEQFINQAKLSIKQDVIDRIFFWTDGNPRITWDICSEVEDLCNDRILTTKDIDSLVHKMYLTTFDRPPIDNIRELVKDDRELRNAIVEIEYYKGKEISDKIKSKLYLTGITNYNNNDIHIKNEVIRKSLSFDWIRKLEEEDKGILKLALELYENQKYTEALSYFEKFLTDENFDECDMAVYYYYMAHAAYCISNFSKTIEYLDLANFNKEDVGNLYYRRLNLKGLAYFHLEKYEDSLTNFKLVIDSGRQDEIYIRALFNYGAACLKSGKKSYWNEAVEIFENVSNEIGINKEKLKIDFINHTKSIAHYNLAQIQCKDGDIDKAIENYRKAIALSKIETKPVILLGLYYVLQDKSEKNRILEDISAIIIENNIVPIVNDPEKSMDFSIDNLKNTLILTFLYKNEEFNKLKPWFTYFSENNLAASVYDLAMYSINHNNNWEMAIEVLNGIYNNFKNPDFNIEYETQYKTLRLLAFHDNDSKRKHEYIDIFSQERILSVGYIDFEIFSNLIYTLNKKKRYNEALKYIEIIKSVKNEVKDDDMINYVVIYNLELNTYFHLNKIDKIREKAKDILDLCNDEKIKKQKSNLLGDTGFETIKYNAESILNPKAKELKPIVAGRTYGRNEIVKVKYKDGKIIQTKFKKVEEDISNKECFILNEEN